MTLIHISTRRDSPCWQMWWTDAKTGRRTFKSTNLSMAEYTRGEAERLMNRGEPTLGGRKHTVAWLADTTINRIELEQYPEKTIFQYRRAFDILLAVRGPDFDIRAMKRDVVPDIKLWCLERNMRADTVNTWLAYLHAAFNFLLKSDIIEANPFRYFPKVKGRVTKKRFLTLEEARRFLLYLDGWKNEEGRRLIRMVLYLGLRRGEVLDIERADVDLANRRLHALNIKRHDKRKRWIPIPEEIIEHFEYFLGRSEKEHPFRCCQPLTLTSWTKRVMRRAGFGEYNLYTLRHTFATLAIQGGMSLRDLQKHMDHSSYAITEHYLHDLPRDDIAPNLGL